MNGHTVTGRCWVIWTEVSGVREGGGVMPRMRPRDVLRSSNTYYCASSRAGLLRCSIATTHSSQVTGHLADWRAGDGADGPADPPSRVDLDDVSWGGGALKDRPVRSTDGRRPRVDGLPAVSAPLREGARLVSAGESSPVLHDADRQVAAPAAARRPHRRVGRGGTGAGRATGGLRGRSAEDPLKGPPRRYRDPFEGPDALSHAP